MRIKVSCAVLFALVSCKHGTIETADIAPVADATPTKAAKTMPRYDPAAYQKVLQRIETRRRQFQRRYAAAASRRARAAIRTAARKYILKVITRDIFPAWMGTPWGMARNSTSLLPHQRDMTVGCSYFITSVLLNVGLRLDNRYRFAQAPALHIQRSLAPKRASLQRYFSIPAKTLEARIAKQGDGLYVIGLVNHIAFVVIQNGNVKLVHSGYVPNANVIDEPFATAQVIAVSKKAGYFVTPLFADDRLVEHWLRAKPVPFQKLGV